MVSRRLLISYLIMAASIRGASSNTPDTLPDQQYNDIVQQIVNFRRTLREAVANKDVNQLKAMYSATYTHTHGMGKMDGREARIVSLIKGEPTIEMALLNEPSFRIHGPDMIILTGRSPILNIIENREYDFRWVQVFSRSSGDWQIVFSQATRLTMSEFAIQTNRN